MEFLMEYGVFLAKAATIVIAIIVVISSLASLGNKNRKPGDGHIEITNLTEEIDDVKEGMLEELLTESEFKQRQKAKKKQQKAEQKAQKKALKEQRNQTESETKKKPNTAAESSNGKPDSAEEKIAKEASEEAVAKPTTTEQVTTEQVTTENSENVKSRLFVIDFDGDVEASAVSNLREEITAIVSAASATDRVLVRLESPGGMVHSYGLAASQLSRIKAANLHLIIAVDQVAASGGYMMACVADQIIAAPFAVVGSIGVVAELPNFHRLLKHNKVDYEQHTAGDYKRTLTMFAENTENARDKFKQELEETHELFKKFITANRPSLDIEKVATGEHWYGTQALDLGLIDDIQTSDDYIVHAASSDDVFEISYQVKKPLAERLSFSIHSAIEKGFLSVWQRSIESRLFK